MPFSRSVSLKAQFPSPKNINVQYTKVMTLWESKNVVILK